LVKPFDVTDRTVVSGKFSPIRGFDVVGPLVPAAPGLIAALFAFLAPLAAAPSLDGIWQSEGYGNVYQIRGATLSTFEITAQTCVAGFTARRLNNSLPDREATFRTRDKDLFFFSAGSDDDHKLLIHPDGLSKIRIRRLPHLPAVCDTPTANTPAANFEVFTRTFAEHYIAFDRRRIDWDQAVAANRGKITPSTTPRQLFNVLSSLLQPLGDLHTGLEAPSLKRESPDVFRTGTDRVIRGNIEKFGTEGRRALFAPIDRTYLQGSLRNFCNRQLQFGHINTATGYLRILSFGDYAKHGNDRRALESALDQIFSDPRLRSLIIDVRLSFGGDDHLGLVIASRLATTEYLAYAIQARADPVDRNRWTPADPVMVRPGAGPRFAGPVVELIGPITMSAAETFTQALMGRSPHVTRIGENTQGLFCDPLDRRLPNGWTFSLPNAAYRTADGVAFDVQGIPPDIAVPVFADEDVAAGRDPAIEAALAQLGKPH
jgi:hypothetical protein